MEMRFKATRDLGSIRDARQTHEHSQGKQARSGQFLGGHRKQQSSVSFAICPVGPFRMRMMSQFFRRSHRARLFIGSDTH